MKNTKMKFAVLTALTVLSAQATATGLVTIPAAGFASSAYTTCNPTGNFGSSITINPTTSIYNTCAVFPINDVLSPVAGYFLIAAAVRGIPATTGGTIDFIGNVTDRVWRNEAGTMCIFGSRITWTVSGAILTDIARGGFADSGDVNAGYFIQATTALPVYRIGRTFTSVQAGGLPGFGSNAAIHSSVADVNDNWVDFTTYVSYPYSLISAMTYVEAPCDATSPYTWVKSEAIRLRSTSSQKEIAISGFAPPSAIIP